LKRTLLMLACTCFLSVGSVSAHGVGPKLNMNVTIAVNGVEVVSPANHQMPDGTVYVSLQAFGNVMNTPIELSKDRKQATVAGKTLSNIHMIEGEPTASVRDLANAIGATNVSWDQEKKEAYVLVLPKGTIQLEPHVVPAMGEHWANPAELPLGPIYGVYKGKLVFLEYMVAQEDFAKGKNYVNIAGMKGLPSPSVVQTDIEYQAHGHPGFEIPHFDIHAYFITDEEQQAIK
jgi:hypothetical protein